MEDIPKEIVSFLVKRPVFLATSSKKGVPNLVCVVPNKVKKNIIIITDNMLNKTSINIKENPFASISFYSKGKGFQLKGNIKYQTKGKWFNFVKKDSLNKGYYPKAVVVFNVVEIWDLDTGNLIV